MSKLENLITRLRGLPEAEQDSIAGEVEELLEEHPAHRGQALRDAIKEGAIARASRDRQEAAAFDFAEPWETIQE
jgi:hypothetical protein